VVSGLSVLYCADGLNYRKLGWLLSEIINLSNFKLDGFMIDDLRTMIYDLDTR